MALRGPRSVSLAALLAAGCTVNPQPEPPLQPVDPDDVHVERSPMDVGSVLVLDAGSAPSDAEAWIFDLSSATCPPDVIPINDRGGFQATICADRGHSLRIQLARATEFTRPVDITFDGSDGIPALGCFSVEAPAHVDVGATPVGVPIEAVISLRNDCLDPVVFRSIALRATSPAFELTEAPTMLATGASAVVRVRFTPGAAEVFAEVLFIELPGDPAIRHATTLAGEGR
jgi:hypothetical protein